MYDYVFTISLKYKGSTNLFDIISKKFSRIEIEIGRRLINRDLSQHVIYTNINDAQKIYNQENSKSALITYE